MIFRDEVPQEYKDDILVANVDYLIYKIKSLSSNRKVLQKDDNKENVKRDGENPDEENKEMKDEESKKNDDYVMFGNFKVPKDCFSFQMEKPNMLEEFNKKVFDLIDIAMDESRLSQMPSNWSSWF